MTRQYTREKIAALIDHSVLTPFVTFSELRDQLRKCVEYHVGGICVYPTHATHILTNMRQCRSNSSAPDLKTIAVIDFPHGMSCYQIKVEEIHNTHADEFDVVANGRLLRAEKYDEFANELACIVGAVKSRLVRGLPTIIKVILETCRLTVDEIYHGCELARDAGVAFVKTSTGFGPEGAEESIVKIMVNMLKGSAVQIKASGGIRTPDDVRRMLGAGATRIGTSHTFDILDRWDD